MSWALRSFLSRPHNLLPRLRPVGRRVIHATTFLGRSNLIAPRGYASNSSCGNLHAEVKRHLYVVLDDHKDGYTIHKLDLDDDLDGRLRKPPVLRVALATVTERAQFAGVGSSIVAIGGSLNIDCWSDHCDVRLFLAYDTETAEMEVTNHGLREVNHKAAVAVGGGLYVLDSAHEPVWTWYQRNGGAHLRRPTRRSLMFDNGWSSWEPLSYYSRWSCKQHCWNDVTPPFLTNQITAYASFST